MKVKELVKKINGASAKMPVFIQEGAFGDKREIHGPEVAGYYYDEEDRTVASISIGDGYVTIHYKPNT